MANRIAAYILFAVLLFWCFVPTPARAMTRTLQHEPALVLAAFGTTTKARATYDFFENQLRRDLPEEMEKLRIEWAFTSEIVRERANRTFQEAGSPERLRSLPQVLADLEAEGFRRIVLQPLHIFPGQEYDELLRALAAFEQLGLRIETGHPLLHTWDQVFEAIEAVSADFLPATEGCTVLAAHGTPETANPATSTYLGLARHLEHEYPQVVLGGVDGVLTRSRTLAEATNCKVKKVRIVPFMYVAGDHVMHDIMGNEPDDEGVPSWALELRQAGFTVESVTTSYQGQELFKGLGFNPEVNEIFIKQIAANLKRLGTN